eukprot:14389212-Heterocapsa_arctica.AAC.1
MLVSESDLLTVVRAPIINGTQKQTVDAEATAESYNDVTVIDQQRIKSFNIFLVRSANRPLG